MSQNVVFLYPDASQRELEAFAEAAQRGLGVDHFCFNESSRPMPEDAEMAALEAMLYADNQGPFEENNEDTSDPLFPVSVLKFDWTL